MASRAYTEEEIAQVCYEANRALQDVLGDSHVPAPWQALVPAARQSYVRGVAFALGQPHLRRRVLAMLLGGTTRRTEREQHEAWMADKLAQGWTWGPAVDEEKRTHPRLVPYEDLLPGERDKDGLFLAVASYLALPTRPV